MIEAGRGTYYASDPVCMWPGHSKLKIGRFCSIGAGIVAYLNGEHPIKGISAFPFEEMLLHIPIEDMSHASKGDIVIGNDVWIADCVIFMSGATVGDGCVIGAHSVVRGAIEPYSIAYGNPCAVIKPRFKKDEQLKLRIMKWWDWPDEWIAESWKILRYGPVSALWEFYEKKKDSYNETND